jgi:protocatechuate 3,4-dioxygenase beta subunit
VREWYDNKTSLAAADLVEVTPGNTFTANAVLAAGGTVSGRVTNDEDTGIQGVRVQLRDLANVNRFAVNTNANGDYTIKGITAGLYKVFFNTYSASGSYLPEFYNDKQLFKDGETINLTAVQTITGIDAVLAPGCTISGTVTDESANPLELIDVYILGTDGTGYGGTYTDSSGQYQLRGLKPGTYKVWFYPYERNYYGVEDGYPSYTNYRIEWYNDKDTFLAGDAVSTSLETPAAGIDAVLTENGGGISGRITDSLGNGIAGASIALYQSEYNADWYDSNISDADGNYLVKGLAPGNYTLLVFPPGGTFYRREFYNDILDYENATPVPVTAGQTTTGIDIVLDKGGLITGRVTDSNGNGLPNVTLRLLDPTTNKYLGWIGNSARTDWNGNYTLYALAGQWKVMFHTCDPLVNTYLSEFYDDQSTVENAAVITVDPEQTVTGIDAVLITGGGKISGYVKDPGNSGLYNAEVDVYDAQYESLVGYAFADASGYFEVSGLIPGNYKIFAVYKNIYPEEWYSDKTTYETANILTVTSGGNTPVTIILGGSNPDQSGISGRVTDSSGGGTANLQVNAYDLNQNFVQSGTTDNNGDYVITGLAAGSYKVFYNGATAGNYLSEWYNDKGAFDEADTLTLETGQSLPGIDAQLTDGGVISGRVANESNEGIENVRVRVRTLERYWVGNAYTDADGNYSIQCLASASYKVYFFTAPAVGMYVSEWYNDKMNFNFADPIPVTAGQTTPLSVVLESGGNISGQVIDQAQAGIQGVQVVIKDLTNVNRATAITDANGNYLVVGLPVGDYKVYFNPTYSNLNYLAEWYTDKDSFKNGDMVTVTLGNTTQVNAELATGSSISGTVTDDSANPIEFAEVYVYDTAGVYYGGVYTDSSGHYQVNGLPAGNYKVNFFPYELDHYAVEWYGLPRNYNYQYEWYNDQASFITAGLVPVTLETPTTGIDAVLAENCGTISGRITDGTGTGIPGCTVYALQSPDDFDWYPSVGSDAEGNYQLKGLPPGNYIVWFTQPANTFYRRQFYNNIFNVEQATPVPVLAGQTTTGIDAVLLKGGFITGRVTDGNGNGIGNVLVRPIDVATNQYIGWTTGNANTDARGYYLINARAGTWKVMFEANQANGGYRSEFYNDAATVETAAAFTVNPEQTVSGIDAILSSGGGTLSGYVKDPAGTGLANVGIEVYDAQYNIAVGPAWTDASGYFEVPGLLPGNYTIYTRYNNVYPSEWYSDKTTYETADAILVTEGRTSPVTIILGGANPNLPNISGRVTDYAGAGLENVIVNLYDLNQEFIVSVTTDANGDYAFYNIPAGDYKLYSDASTVGNYISEWYQNTLSFDEAETLTVTAEVPLEHIDVGLTAGGIIAGHITNETGQGIQDVRVVIRDRQNTWIAASDSDADGNYSISRLVPDSYKVFFRTDNAVGLYVKEWYNDKENFNTADLLVVPAGETTTLDVTLASGGAISGTITNGTDPIENMAVDIYALNGIYINTDYTDGSGNYLVKGVPVGTYKVNFNPWELNYHGVDWYGLPRNYNYQYQWYNQKEGFVDADEVPVTVGNTTTGIDAVMSETAGGIISGRITDSTGNGIAGAYACAFESFDNQLEWYYSDYYNGTGSDGNYEIKGLPTGNYVIMFFPPGGSLYRREYYNNQQDPDLVDRVSVTAGTTSTSIGAVLEKGGVIWGHVTDSTGNPLPGVWIRLIDAATNKYYCYIANYAQTDENGEYQVPINAGQWKVMFQTFDMTVGGYVSEFYNNKATVETATVVTAAAEEPTPNVDAVLSYGGGKISGYVKDPAETGLRNAQVQIFDAQYRVLVGSKVTDSSGYFELVGLIPGNYKVYTLYYDVYPSEWYSDQTAYETAKSLTVTTGGNTYIEVVLGGDDPVNPGQLCITSPNGGESLTGGTTHQITWTSVGSEAGENVIIEYSLDDGVTWIMITSAAADTGSYSWTVPAVNSGTCRVKITSGDGDTGISDVSDEPFGIVSTLPPSIRLMSPKRWIQITAGTVQAVTWTSTGNVSQVVIEYSTDSGITWSTIAASVPNTGSYQWAVPDTPSQHCHLRIRLGNGDSESAPFDMTDNEFSIVTTTTPTLTITSPNGGESWRVGTAHTITWVKTGNVPNVKIEYTVNGGSSWLVIIAGTPNTGSYPWAVPNNPSGQCKVRVSDIDNNPTDMSNAVFSIEPLPTLTLISPNGGETWQAGTAHDITWTWTGSNGDVKIEYSTNSGTSWNLVTSSAGGGIYSWTVPDTPSQNCLVRVGRNDSDEGPTDISDGVFTIEAAPLLALQAPNGGEQWKAGETYRISWTASNLEGNVVIDLYRGDDFDFNIGATSVNDCRLEWQIPENFKNANDYRVVIHKDLTEDSSDKSFSITERKPNNPDFDNDGKVDIIWKNPVTGQNEVWYMDGTRRKTIGILPPRPGKDFQVVGTADFNRDGKVDILWHDTKNGQNLVWYMDGIQQKGAVVLPAQPGINWQVVGTGDFNGDGKTDILWRHVLKGLGQVWFMDGVAVTGNMAVPSREDPDWQAVATGDFNDDEKVDILWRNLQDGRNEVWFMDGVVRTGTMAVQEQPRLQWQVEGTGDFNGDEHVDILWRRSSDGKHLVWYMDGVVRIGYEYINIPPDTRGSSTSDLN